MLCANVKNTTPIIATAWNLTFKIWIFRSCLPNDCCRHSLPGKMVCNGNTNQAEWTSPLSSTIHNTTQQGFMRKRGSGVCWNMPSWSKNPTFTFWKQTKTNQTKISCFAYFLHFTLSYMSLQGATFLFKCLSESTVRMMLLCNYVERLFERYWVCCLLFYTAKSLKKKKNYDQFYRI